MGPQELEAQLPSLLRRNEGPAGTWREDRATTSRPRREVFSGGPTDPRGEGVASDRLQHQGHLYAMKAPPIREAKGAGGRPPAGTVGIRNEGPADPRGEDAWRSSGADGVGVSAR